MQLLEGRKAVVTGGSRGIGREICLLLAENGADVALAYRKSTVEAEQLREEITAMGRSCIAVQADVSVSADVDRFVTQAAQALGGIDILVNCAGVFPQALIEDITDEDWSRVMRINLDGAFYACRAAAPYLKKSGKNGRIINLCSTRYLQSEAGTEAYSASKGGIYSLTHSLAVSLAPLRITVNAIAPGWIHVREEEPLRSEDHQFHPSGRVGEPGDIARMCLFLCDEANDFLNGQTLTVDGGATIRMIYPE
mgnify:CR=1 FL=1